MLVWFLAFVALFLAYLAWIRPMSYWREREVPYVKPWPIVGNFMNSSLRRRSFAEEMVALYKELPTARIVGIFQGPRPLLLLRDLELIKLVGIKEFDHFPDHFSMPELRDTSFITRSLISLRGAEWKQMRATLSPIFTTSKIKAMFLLMDECAAAFVQHFLRRGEPVVEVEMKDIFTKFTNDVIATTAFGIKCDSLNDPDNTFFKMGNSINNLSALQIAKLLLIQFFPFILKIRNIQIFDMNTLNYFKSIILDTIAEREKKNILRPDLINLLMQARKNQLVADENSPSAGFASAEEFVSGSGVKKAVLSDDDLVAQAMLFFLAGFETVSIITSFLAYELAVNPDVQRRLHAEVDQVKQSGANYESLVKMKYLDQVVSEGLRLWPPGFQTDRQCAKDFVVVDGENRHVIKRGYTVVLPIMGIHRDPQYFPEPLRFDPERFSDENRANIVPGSYLPFGVGPRNCIASRFALLETKTLLFHLLANFSILPIEKTEIPIKLTPKKLNLATENGIWLGLKARKPPTSL